MFLSFISRRIGLLIREATRDLEKHAISGELPYQLVWDEAALAERLASCDNPPAFSLRS